MRKLIQLDPKKAPLHPMLGVTKRSVINRSNEAFAKEEYAEFIENISFFLGGTRFTVVDMGDAREVLDAYAFEETRFRNFSDDYWILNSLKAGNGKLRESIDQFIQLVDMSTGSLFIDPVPNNSVIIDITGLKPFEPIVFDPDILYLLRLDTYLGVDVNWVVLLKSEDKTNLDYQKLSVLEVAAIRLMNHILSDYKFQKDLAIRDYNYKSALIENLIDSQESLHFYINDKKLRSGSVYSFYIDGKDPKWFYQKLFEMGFEIGKSENETGNEYYSIANFINHSKEQIELFVDKVSDLLK